MKKTQAFLLGLLASCLLASAANAKGLLGTQYFDLAGGYLHLDGPDGSSSGVGANIEINAPIITDRLLGLDFLSRFQYMRLRPSDLAIDEYGIGGHFRAYAPIGNYVFPYTEAGLGWSSAKVRDYTQSDPDNTDNTSTERALTLPVGAGVEFRFGQVSLAPFFTYVVGLERDLRDVTSFGAKGVYWVNPEWGMSLTVTHSDLDRDTDRLAVIAGFVFAY